MDTIMYVIGIGAVAFMINQLLIPVLSRIAFKFNLVDKPNYRKIHLLPIPLIGGISIAISTILTILISDRFEIVEDYLMISTTSVILLIMGCIDDQKDIKASYKLALELLLAISIAASGTRIESLYGLLGVYHLGIAMQYFLTIIVITGVVNAINLFDGVDGLAGTYSLLGFILLGIIGLYIQNQNLLLIGTIFAGSLLSFLRKNFSPKKIFMGDSGALFLGFMLITLGIKLLQNKPPLFKEHASYGFIIMAAYFSIPVLDSIRVYLGRIKNGYSPFMPDRSHLHHLLLKIGMNHKSITFLIVSFCISMLLVNIGFSGIFPITIVLVAMVVIFAAMVKVLLLIHGLKEWGEILKKLEQSSF
ncbi:glycosyltransferase family 4 protein [Pedobacter helvus]|uniref:Glycosyltransferase family 4 protein n=1 Tax=Pedobacter helvus TaxID=2563444 RepID=A0ABW9JJ60_9SPHI|nr:MraY family glycosyltransferase [Pedobacter ureilyticus]